MTHFTAYSWNMLTNLVQGFKLAINTTSVRQREWNTARWEEVCTEMNRIESILADTGADERLRLACAKRIIGAHCRSCKVLLPHEVTGRPGIVTEAFDGVNPDEGPFVSLPHVMVRFEGAEGTLRHRLEDIRLKKESWWFSLMERKPKK